MLEGFFEEVFGTPAIAAGFLLVTAVLLILGEKLLSGDKLIENITLPDAMVVGLFQTLALFPGVSRSVRASWATSSTEEAIRAYCRERLAPYKVPASVEFRNFLPKTMVGKILRRALAETEARAS